MKELKKIKIKNANQGDWPFYLNEAFQLKDLFHLEMELGPKSTEESPGEYLFFDQGKLQLCTKDLGIMSLNFEDLLNYHKKQNYALSKEPLAKALGIKGPQKKVIWDATCGTAKDTLLIYSFGAKLVSFERNPTFFLLLQDALRRCPIDINLVFGDASKLDLFFLPEKPEVIYYDPMYPSLKKSALPRKEMRIFKNIVGEDFDSEDFLKWAKKIATERIVVKRPLEGKPLLENPTASYKGKSTRYDMYKIF